MRIGIDSRLLYYESGGISQYIRNLVASLATIDQSNHYKIFHSRKDVNLYIPSDSENFKREVLWTPSHHRLEGWTLGAEIIRYGLNLFHSPDFIPPRFGSRHMIVTVHDLNFLFFPEFLDQQSLRYYAGQIREAVGRADHILADSHHTRNDLIDSLNVPEAKVTTIHLAANPIFQEDPSVYEVTETLSSYNLPRDYILFVGTISPRKNLQLLVKAYDILKNEAGIDIPVVIVGRKGWQAEEFFNSVQELGLQERVLHLDNVSFLELPSIYKAASVLVFPSKYEGFGLPPLEAMHMGCPVVASNRSSLPEVVGDGGIQLDPDDLPSWPAAIERLLSDTDYRDKMITLGNQQVKKFRWGKTARETLAVYEQVAKDG